MTFDELQALRRKEFGSIADSYLRGVDVPLTRVGGTTALR
jgi:hypothetical protein